MIIDAIYEVCSMYNYVIGSKDVCVYENIYKAGY